jgi:DNA-binding NtrC family response regulator
MSDGWLDRLVPALLNPFGSQAAAHAAAVALAADHAAELHGQLAGWAAAGRTKEARRLLLCLGVGRVAAGREPVDGQLPGTLFADLGFSRVELGAVLAAAGRCQARLEALAGTSAAARTLRADTWATCFGSSLDDALRLRSVIRQQNVLILGETGTGKEMVAAALRDGDIGDGRSGQPSPAQVINAAAVPAELWETELFGHTRGAFSGAARDRQGKIVAADGGTLFLDEIGDLPLATQPKLLRAIESNRITPVGSNDEISVDVRYLAATSLLLEALVARGVFRRDLYERLAGVLLTLPPLRDRPEDIVPVARAILERLQDEERRRQSRGNPVASIFVRLAGDLEDWDLQSYDWPGNVRELENFLRMRILGLGGPPRRNRPAHTQAQTPVTTTPATAEPARTAAPPPAGSVATTGTDASGTERILRFEATLDEVRDWYIEGALARHQGRRAQAAQSLGVDRNTLRRHLNRLRHGDLDDPDDDASG